MSILAVGKSNLLSKKQNSLCKSLITKVTLDIFTVKEIRNAQHPVLAVFGKPMPLRGLEPLD
jgi:hypothetical protein